ncbi:hypothetical protein ACTD5D_12330 [Nocardia takedensis]|uniref:hypothetical protein n=1 Tax=Nocardia takedensis TaxID=259390 RepID=UPI0002DE03B3|nr:hypothetical protein [Nocardia takedensis]
MSRSARRVCLLLVLVVAAVVAFLSAGPSTGTVRDLDEDGREHPAEDRDALVVDLFLA